MKAFWTEVKTKAKEPEKEIIQEEVPAQTVFSINEAEIEKNTVKQCTEHRWRKVSDTELMCTICPTQITIKPGTIKDFYVK